MSNVDTNADTEVVRARVAKHEYLDATGNVVENEEDAHGVRYTLLASGKHFDYIVDTASPAGRMLAVFGAKTLATNEASQARQKGGENADQIGAITERFELIGTGKWVDKTGGARFDLDTLAQAIVNVGASKGKSLEVAAIRERLDSTAPEASGLTFFNTVKDVAEIKNEYTKLRGRKVASVDEVFAGL